MKDIAFTCFFLSDATHLIAVIEYRTSESCLSLDATSQIGKDIMQSFFGDFSMQTSDNIDSLDEDERHDLFAKSTNMLLSAYTNMMSLSVDRDEKMLHVNLIYPLFSLIISMLFVKRLF